MIQHLCPVPSRRTGTTSPIADHRRLNGTMQQRTQWFCDFVGRKNPRHVRSGAGMWGEQEC